MPLPLPHLEAGWYTWVTGSLLVLSALGWWLALNAWQLQRTPQPPHPQQGDPQRRSNAHRRLALARRQLLRTLTGCLPLLGLLGTVLALREALLPAAALAPAALAPTSLVQLAPRQALLQPLSEALRSTQLALLLTLPLLLWQQALRRTPIPSRDAARSTSPRTSPKGDQCPRKRRP